MEVLVKSGQIRVYTESNNNQNYKPNHMFTLTTFPKVGFPSNIPEFPEL